MYLFHFCCDHLQKLQILRYLSPCICHLHMIFHHSRWLQPRKFKDSFAKVLPTCTFCNKVNNTLDFVYTTEKNAYKAVPRPHLGFSDHISVMLIPAYRPLLKLAKPVQKLITIWPENATSTLQDCFQCTDWNMFKEAATYNNHTDLQEYTETVTAFIKKCIDDVTVTKTITTRAIGMGDMGLKIYHDISVICCDNDINDDNSGNPVSLEKSIIFPIFTPNRVLWALLSTHVMLV